MAKAPAIDGVLARFDAWQKGQPETVRAWLRPGAAPAKIDRAAKTLGVAVPASLRALLGWRDGEAEDGALFDALLREAYEPTWSAFSNEPLEVRFMSLEEIARAGTFDAWYDEDTGECLRHTPEIESGTHACKLVPFIWCRARRDAPIDGDGDTAAAREPWDEDWLVAVDTFKEGVWLFEIADEGFEGVQEEGADLATWLAIHVTRLEKGDVDLGVAAGAGAAVVVDPPAIGLLKLLLEKEQIELADDATIDDVAERLAPILTGKVDGKPPPAREAERRTRAIAGAMAFFEDDDGIGELYADDDVLRTIVGEFVD